MGSFARGASGRDVVFVPSSSFKALPGSISTGKTCTFCSIIFHPFTCVCSSLDLSACACSVGKAGSGGGGCFVGPCVRVWFLVGASLDRAFASAPHMPGVGAEDASFSFVVAVTRRAGRAQKPSDTVTFCFPPPSLHGWLLSGEEEEEQKRWPKHNRSDRGSDEGRESLAPLPGGQQVCSPLDSGLSRFGGVVSDVSTCGMLIAVVVYPPPHPPLAEDAVRHLSGGHHGPRSFKGGGDRSPRNGLVERFRLLFGGRTVRMHAWGGFVAVCYRGLRFVWHSPCRGGNRVCSLWPGVLGDVPFANSVWVPVMLE